MKNHKEHIISHSANARQALQKLDNLPDNESRTLFVVDEAGCLVGTLTDGDIRRGLLKDREITDCITTYMNTTFKYILGGEADIKVLNEFKKQSIFLIPFVNSHLQIQKIIDLRAVHTILPATVLIMAGGKGERLRPLTETIPKPMLKVGDKPIIEHNIDRLIKYGITDFYISVRYLAQQIVNYLGDGTSRNISIKYLYEEEPLGTIGALKQLDTALNENIIVLNSDILTNIDYEDFFQHYKRTNAKMCMASVPYHVKIPYGVLGFTEDNKVATLREKPTYTYYSNAGIYFLHSSVKNYIPSASFCNATDLMESLIADQQNVVHYPLLNYWLDIGKHDDYLQAQKDIIHINL